MCVSFYGGGRVANSKGTVGGLTEGAKNRGRGGLGRKEGELSKGTARGLREGLDNPTIGEEIMASMGEELLAIVPVHADVKMVAAMDSSPEEDNGQDIEDTDPNKDQTEDEFIQVLESLFKERNLKFKVPTFYGKDLKVLKLWKAVIALGGYDCVTSRKLWGRVGDMFSPPKSCTTISFTFRVFYEKILLDYERSLHNGSVLTSPTPLQIEPAGSLATSHLITDRRKSLRGKRPCTNPNGANSTTVPTKPSKKFRLKKVTGSYQDGFKTWVELVDVPVKNDSKVGNSASWIKITVYRTSDSFEVYALVPGISVQGLKVESHGAGKLVLSGKPDELQNPWKINSFRKFIELPSEIEAHQVTAQLDHFGQMHIHAPVTRNLN